jgi:DNA polymerase III subunit beta
MRLRIERDALADAVAWVARALPARPVVPVLAGMLLEAGDGLALSCFDYDVSARMETSAEVAEPGTVLVPGRLLAEITRSLPGGLAELEDEADSVWLRCGSAEFTLVKLAAEEYPALPELPAPLGSVDGGQLAAAVSQVAPSASRDDTLPMLTGVFAEIEGETITLAATDRYRLAVRDLSWEPKEPDVRAAALVPARTLAEAARTMTSGIPVAVSLRSAEDTARRTGQEARAGTASGPGEASAPGSGATSEGGYGPADRARPGGGVATRAADGMIGFESGGRRLTTRLLGGEFLKYSSRFPAEFGSRAEMPPGPLIEAVRRVSLVAERGSPVRLAFSPGEVVIEAGTQGQARATERVPAVFSGEERIIAFNPQYLLDGLTAAATTAASGVAHGRGRSAPGRAGQAEGMASGASTGRAEAEGAAGEEAAPGSAGATGTAAGAKGAAARGGSLRLEFTSAVRPAVITWAPGEPGTQAEPPAGAEAARPDFRYLVVPLRIPSGT